MKQLIQEVEKWFADRQIIENSTPLKQALKTSEEVLELQNAIIDNDLEEIKDAIGDIQVTLIGVCLHYGSNCKELFSYKIPDLLSPITAISVAIIIDKDVNILKSNIDTQNYSDTLVMRCLIDLNHISKMYNLTLEECLQSAYDVISKRQGKMINGQFVKEEN